MAWELSDEQKKIANKVSSKRKSEEPQKNSPSSKGTWELSEGQKEIARNVASRYAGQAQNTYKNMSGTYNAAINRIAGGTYLDRQERTNLRRQLYDLEGDVGRLQSYFNTQNDGGAFSGDIQMLKEASEALAGAHESLDFWSQFESEDDYSTYLSHRAEYERLSKFDFDQAEKQLEALNLQLEAKQKEIPPMLRTGALGAGGARQPSAVDSEIAAIKQQITELQREYKQATDVQRQNKYAAYADNEDFEQYSAMGASIENPTIEEWGKGNTNIFGWKPFASEEREVKNKVSFGRDNYNQLVAGVQSNSSPEIGYLLYNSMTDDEVATYNYILAKEGAESADAYLSHLEETLNYRMGNQQAASIENIDSSALRGGAKALYGVGAGLDQWVSGTRQLFTPEELPTSATQFGSSAIRESLSDDWAQLPEWLGGDTLAQAAYDAITTTANMAPSILLGSFVGGLGAPAAVSKAVSGVALGASAKGNAYNQALKDGYTQQEARNYSTLIGASEAALSYVLGGIGKLGGIATNKAAQAAIRNIDNTLLRIAANVGINMAGEGFEEYLQEILEPVYRNLCFNENNEFRIFTEEAAYSFLLGSLTAAFMEGGSNISSGISANKLGKMIQEAGNVDALIDSALALDHNSEAFGLAQRMKDGKLHVNSSNLGDLLTAYKEAGGTSDFLAEIPADAAQEAAPAQVDELREAAMDAVIAQEREAEQTAPVMEASASVPRRTDRRSTPAEPNATASPVSNQAEQASANMRQVSQPQEKVVATRQRAAFNDSGEELEVAGVSFVENGKLYVSIDGGGTAAVDDISFDDPRIDALYANAATFDTQTAKAFISGYDGSSDVGAYYSGFASIYGAARSGKSMQQAISNSLHASSLSLEAQQLAYHAGVNAGPVTDAKMSASAAPRVTRAIEEARPASPPRSVSNQQRPVAQKKGSGVVREFRGGIDAEQDKSLRVLDAVAKAIGRKVHVVDSITRGADGAPALNATDAKGSIIEGSTNAYFDEETNEYYISLGGVGQAYMYFALHESVHDIAKNNALGYENLERIVFEILESKGADIASMMDVQRRLYPNEDDAYLRQEIVANTVPAILTDKATADAFLDRVMGADADTRTAFEKLLDSIRDFLKKTYDVLKGQKSWQQMELIKGDLDAIDRIREAYFAALEDMQGQDTEQQEAVEFSDSEARFSIRDEAPPKKVGIAYKVFAAKDGQLYPPMVPNPGGAGTPVGVWLNADAGEAAAPSKTGRPQVKAGGKGTSTGKTSLAYRPGWHLGDIPLAKQFARTNPETGAKDLFPANFVWAECEYAMDVDYQEEAMSYGYTENGKFRHSYAGLPKIPTDGYYRYRTNPNPDTVPWVITGAMRVKRILTDAETDAICRENGVEPMKRQGGEIDLSKYGLAPGAVSEVSASKKVRLSAKDPEALTIKEQIAQHQTELNKMKPVATIESDARPRKDGKPNRTLIRKALQAFYGSLKYSVDREGFGKVQFDENALSELCNYITSDAEFAAAKAAPSVIKRGMEIEHHIEHNRHSDVESYTFAAPVVLNGKRGNEAVVVQFTNRNKPHCVRILMPDGSGFDLDATKRSSPNRSQGVQENSRGQLMQTASDNTILETSKKGKGRMSLKDSQGNDLSAQQAEYFKDSKVRDENGNLLVMYHGTPYGGFSQFRSGTYFTQKEWLAETYHSPSASSIRGKYDPATNPMTYAVYLDMRKPFDTRNAKERRIFEKEYYQQYGMGTPLMESGLPDWFDGSDLMEFIEEKGYDYDGLILDEGGMGGYGEEVISRGLSYVIFDPAQAKSTDNKAPTSSPNMRFSMIDPVEETDDLIAVHNLTGDNLAGVLELGGFPMPSIAVLRASQGHERYGDISIIFGKDTINPGTNRQNKVYGGDAWTPSFPRIEYEVNAKEAAKIRKRVYGVAGGYAALHELGSINLDEDNLETDLNRYDGDAVRMFSGNVPMKYAYLRDTGAEYELPTKTETLGKYSGHDNSVIQGVHEELGADLLDELMDAGYARYKSDTELIERLLRIINAAYGGKSNFKELGFSQYDNLLRDARKFARNGAAIGEEIDYATARSQIDSLVPQAEYEAWLRELFGDIIKSRGIRNNADYFTPSGNRRSFAALHWAVTLDNIVKAMKGGHSKGGGMFGGNSIFGLATKDYKSISDIKADVSRLRVANEDEYEEIKETYQQRLLEIADEIKPPSERNSFIALDNSVKALLDAVRRGKSKAGIARVLNNEYKGYYNIQSDTAQKIHDLVRDIYEMPTEYFEAKPERAVGLDEIRAVIMPRGEYEDIRARLQQRNIPVEEYDPGTEGDRLRALNSEPARKLRFSLKDTAHVSSAALESEIARKDQMIADLKAQFKLTEGHKVSDKALEKLARRVLKEYSSGYSLPALQENLRTMFDYIANAEQPAWDDIVSMGAGMAKAIIKQSSELDTTMHEYYADARDYLRNTRISLSSTQRSEAAYTAGSYREYRQSLFGSVNLTNDGISLDSVWGELSEMHPELFDPDATEGEMIPALLNAVDAMKPVYRNPYGYDMDGAAYDLFLRLYDEYFDIPEVKTFADKKAAELARVKARYTNKIAEIRQESKERYDARLKALRKENVSQRREYSQKYKKLKDEEALLVRMVEGRARNEERQQRLKEVRALKEKIQRQYRALTDDRNERLLKQRARFREWKEADRAKRQEREEATRYRNSIAKTAATLREMLASPKLKEGKYVPDFLREPVLNILSALDFTGARGGEGRQLKWRASMESLYHEYENYILAHSDDPNTQQLAKNASRYMDVQLMLHDAFMPVFEEFLEKTKGIDALGALDSTALEQLDMLLKSVSANIRDINRLYKNKRFASAANAGDTGIAYANNTRQHKKWRFLNKIKDFASMDMLDSYSWGIRMGEAGESIIGELSDGLENSYSKVREASEFFSKLKQKLKVKDADIHSWTQAVNGIKLDSGKTIRMSTAQIMELYALYNRPQARQHILKGGIEIDDITPKTGKIVEQKGAYAVTERDIARIFQKITPKQRDMIDAMQRFMSTTVAGWGNETTQELYMIDMYREPKYWTIRASRSSINAQDPAQRRTFNAVMNSSFTKATNRFAGNPIAIGDAFQTFGDHVAGMAVYNGLAMPIDDAMKWLNYRQRDESGAIVPNANTKLAIDKVMGDAGYQYFTNLIQDLNGLSSSSYSTQLSAKLLSNFKRASVAGKLRVVVQQPTAVFRALSEIKGKYLLSAIVKKHSIKEMRENSPIAWWKSQGNYEIGTGRSLRSVIIGDDTGYQKMMDKAMKPAGAADDLTWSHIWEAVKLEVKAEHRGLTGQAYMEKVKERFSEIVNKTQVVDSIMHRSQAMRSQDVALKQATAFLSEPTKTYNMLSNAVYGVFNARGKNRGKALKRLAQVGAAWVLTQAVHAAVLATHDTFRDRDDEEEYWDAWLENYTANFIDGLNLFSSIPYVSQAVSLIQGYDASNMELEAIEAIVDAGNGWGDYFKGESKKTLYGLISSSVSALSYLTGAPFGGLMASAETLINAFAPGTIRKKQFTTTEGYEVLYSAITEGDTATRDRLREEFLADRIETIEKSEQEKIAAGEMPAYADSASIEAAAKLHMENNLSTVLANNPSIATAYNYRTAGDASSLRSLYRELEAMGFTTNEITKAINKYETAMNAEPGTQEAKHTAIYDRQNLFAAIRASVTSGDYEDIGIIRDELIATSNAVDPVASINSAVATEFKGEYLDYLEQGNDYMAERLGAVLESEFGHDQDDRDKWLKDAYKDSVATGDILSQAGYKDALLDRGFDQEAIDELYAAAQMKALAEEFYEAHPEYEDYSVNAVNKYQQYGEPLNIEANDFFNAWDFYSDAKALVDEDGNAISGSKKALVLAYIDKMALSITQKDALYYIFGYAESTIGDAPWH